MARVNKVPLNSRFYSRGAVKRSWRRWRRAQVATHNTRDTFTREHTHLSDCFHLGHDTRRRSVAFFPTACNSNIFLLKAIFRLEKATNLWWSAARGARGQPVILNTLGLASPHGIWLTLQAGPSLKSPATQMPGETDTGQAYSHDHTGIKRLLTSTTGLKCFLFCFCRRNFFFYFLLRVRLQDIKHLLNAADVKKQQNILFFWEYKIEKPT